LFAFAKTFTQHSESRTGAFIRNLPTPDEIKKGCSFPFNGAAEYVSWRTNFDLTDDRLFSKQCRSCIGADTTVLRGEDPVRLQTFRKSTIPVLGRSAGRSSAHTKVRRTLDTTADTGTSRLLIARRDDGLRSGDWTLTRRLQKTRWQWRARGGATWLAFLGANQAGDDFRPSNT
jgi:hypothetical protein